MTSFPDIKPIYRLILPILVGALAYLAILMAFDTVEALFEDFFTRELFFCMAVSGLLLEANRGLLLAFKRKLVNSKSFQNYAIALITCATATSLLVVSGLLIGYFAWFENMTEVGIYTTELKIFNGVFLFVTLLFQSHFLGFYLIHLRFERELARETRQKESLDRHVNLFHYQLNPKFLLTCLDSILLRLKEREYNQADEGILLLSEIYRHSLKMQEELVPLQDELQAMHSTGTFLNQFNAQHIEIKNHVGETSFLLVPRTLSKLLEAIAQSQLSSSSTPLKLTIEVHRDQLTLSFPSSFSLVAEEQLYATLQEVKQHYTWLGKEVKWNANATFFIYIPLEKFLDADIEQAKPSIQTTLSTLPK